MRYFIPTLKDQRRNKINGGLYYKLQVDFAYNSNHMEGSRLSKEQTRTLFETKTIGGDYVPADDVIETMNHFRCFDHIIDTYKEPLTQEYIKELHCILKSGTISSHSEEAVIGDYKKYDNIVGELETAPASIVPSLMSELIENYNSVPSKDINDIIGFHVSFEKIHPFYDGNGRIGRLIMFKECIKNGIVPFIITDKYKMFYNKGLYEWQTQELTGRLTDTCLLMQDDMQAIFDYFSIFHDGERFVPDNKAKGISPDNR